MFRISHAPLPFALHPALPRTRRLPAPRPLPTLAGPNWWARLLALFEPAAARVRRERRHSAVVLPLPGRLR